MTTGGRWKGATGAVGPLKGLLTDGNNGQETGMALASLLVL